MTFQFNIIYRTAYATICAIEEIFCATIETINDYAEAPLCLGAERLTTVTIRIPVTMVSTFIEWDRIRNIELTEI